MTTSGRGTIYSFVVFHQLYFPGFKDDVPYSVAMIQLDDGVMTISNVVDCPNEDLYVGMPVEVSFRDVDDQFSIPVFRPVQGPRA